MFFVFLFFSIMFSFSKLRDYRLYFPVIYEEIGIRIISKFCEKLRS